jgi:hypothetical protein
MVFNEYLKFVAVRKIMQLIKLPHRRLYWATKFETRIEGLELPNVSKIISRDRWRQIRRYLRFEEYESPLIDKTDKLWKCRKITTILQNTFQKAICPGRDQAMDESYIQSGTSRNPVGQGARQKPISKGIKLSVLVDCETKTVINFNVCDGQYTAANCVHLPYGVSGNELRRLIEFLVGKGYILYADNYYVSPALAKALKLCEQRIGLIGTIRGDRGVINDIKMSRATKPKPTNIWPKGSITHSYNLQNDILAKGEIYIYC